MGKAKGPKKPQPLQHRQTEVLDKLEEGGMWNMHTRWQLPLKYAYPKDMVKILDSLVKVGYATRGIENGLVVYRPTYKA